MDVVTSCLPTSACPVQVTEEAEQTSLEICAAEKTMEMLTKVRRGVVLGASQSMLNDAFHTSGLDRHAHQHTDQQAPSDVLLTSNYILPSIEKLTQLYG